MEPFYKAFGKKVLEWRKKRGLNQEEVGRLLAIPVTKQTIAKIEAGSQRISLHTLVELAQGLGVDELDLLPDGGSGRRKDEEWRAWVEKRLIEAAHTTTPSGTPKHLTERERKERRSQLEKELVRTGLSTSEAKELAGKMTRKR